MDASVQTVPSQKEPLTDTQVQNSEGGYVWEVDDITRFLRFLCLGVEKGTYYVKEQQLALENAQCISRIIDSEKWKQALDELVKCSVEGRAAKQDATHFALAAFCRQGKNMELKQAAYKVLGEVCRIPTHLFQFLEYCQMLSEDGKGWGRGHRKAITKWYLNHGDNPLRLATLVTKYKNRGGWTHMDVLRLCHPKPESDGVGAVIRYIVKGLSASKEDYLKEDSSEVVKKVFAFLTAIEAVRSAKKSSEVLLNLIKEHRLAREHIPTTLLDDVNIWKMLLPHMPMMALIRNLNKMSQLGLLNKGSPMHEIVRGKLRDEELLRAARIHPFNILVALHTYKKGKGEKGKLAWPVSENIVWLLDRAFYKCFNFVKSTNKRILLALDVSSSMMQPVLGSPTITADCAAAAMSMVSFRTETHCDITAFSHTLVPATVQKNMDLNTVMEVMKKITMGGTDCALPMIWAKSMSRDYDVFIVYTDNETWFGPVHPAQALRDYRVHCGRSDVKLIVVAMTSTGFSIADPNDGGMLDICGFDSAAPELIRNFILGLI